MAKLATALEIEAKAEIIETKKERAMGISSVGAVTVTRFLTVVKASG